MTACEDCGCRVSRRIRCTNCGLMICRWCYHHVHTLITKHVTKAKASINVVKYPGKGKS